MENEYSSYIHRNAGSNNAHTAQSSTNFYFTVHKNRCSCAPVVASCALRFCHVPCLICTTRAWSRTRTSYWIEFCIRTSHHTEPVPPCIPL